MPQQKFTDVLTDFLNARELLAHVRAYYHDRIPDQETILAKTAERLDAMVQPGTALQQAFRTWGGQPNDSEQTHLPPPAICEMLQKIDIAVVEAHEKLTQASAEPEAQNIEPKPVMQYYYKTTDCEAKNSDDESCICWHDEGTGLHKAERFSLHHPFLKWREKPAQVDDAEVRVEEPVSDSYTMLLERSERQPSYGPITHTVMLPRELPEMTEEEAREVGAVCVQELENGTSICKVISRHEVRQIYSRIVEKFGV